LAATPLSVRKFLLLFITWWVVWAVLQAYVIYTLGYSWQLALTDAGFSNLLLAGTCALISNNLQFYLPKKEVYWYLLIQCIFFAGIWITLVSFTLPYLVNKDVAYQQFFNNSVIIRFGVAFLLIGCVAMVSMVWYNIEEQNQAYKRRAAAEQLAKDAELYKLRQQLQPHFLFNSLNSINALIGTRPQEARIMVQQLSEFLRGTLKREEHQWVTLEEELQHLQLYLAIEEIRFGNRLSTQFDIDDEALKLKLPGMLLQPLVENAIKFGLYDTLGDTTINISCRQLNDMLQVSIRNPFDADTAAPNKGTGFGLVSIQRRLYLLFARNDLIITQAAENLFTTTIIIPQHDKSFDN
jgi:two-component system, LytTR family, sensor kinase